MILSHLPFEIKDPAAFDTTVLSLEGVPAENHDIAAC